MFKRFLSTSSSSSTSPLSRQLAYDLIGDRGSDKTALFLHGILGMKRNWRTPSSLFHKAHPSFACVTADHRGHGASRHITTPGHNTVQACALDLLDLFDNEQITPPSVVLAHSFSGKVALQYLDEIEKNGGGTAPKHTWIIDTIPRPYVYDSEDAYTNSAVIHVLSLLHQLPTHFESKEWMIEQLLARKVEKPVALWITSNVVPTVANPSAATIEINKKEAFTWGFNLATIDELFHDFCQADMWDMLKNYEGQSQIHFVRAGKNNSWTSDVLRDFDDLINSKPYIHLHTMSHVGHWVHTDDLPGLLALVNKHSVGIDK